ncbi:MAG: class I SAM-dependent methyltransferase [Bacteroidetes bacterium]|nr:MAG: class I SAM-dependent methyltransferase [Bacteroidota bacterium]
MEPLSDHTEQGVFLLSPPEPAFCDAYQTYLQKTNRCYDDAEVREFPSTFFYNLHRQSWMYRKKTLDRFIPYLKRNAQPRRILDLGCGTGWLAARLAGLPQTEVVGLDLCMPLVTQAARVFSMPNLQFACGDIFEDILPKGSFDLISLCDAIAWFPHLPSLINRCREFLQPGGELHILESFLGSEKQKEAAEEATELAFTEAGIPELSRMYHHHLRQELAPYDFRFMYRPSRFKAWLGIQDSPHPWVRITN